MPVQLNGVDCFLETEIVKKSLPLLISKESMKKAETKLDLINDTITMFGIEKPMEQTASGHYAVSLSNNKGNQKIRKNINEMNTAEIQHLLIVEIRVSPRVFPGLEIPGFPDFSQSRKPGIGLRDYPGF